MMSTSLLSSLGSLALCLFLTLFAPCFFSSLPINFLAAPFVMLFYTSTLSTTIWLSFLSGCCVDSLMLSPRFGFLGLSFAVTSWLLYDWRLYFFKDSRLTILIMTYCFSFVCTLIQNIIALFFDLPLSFYSLKWLYLFLMPFFDAIFAWTLFSLFPFVWQLYRIQRKRRKERKTA
jgi:hypothetical protein